MDNELIAKYLGKTASPDEERALLNWVEESEENKQLFARYKNTWATARMLGVDNEQSLKEKFQGLLTKIDQDNSLLKRRSVFSISMFKRFSRMAAAILLTAGISFMAAYLIWHRSENSQAFHQITVPAGQQAQLTLADGTKIWLNSRSKLTYPAVFKNSSREVVLEGEAYFQVFHNKEVPFLVKTSNIAVKVLGTSFNVSSYSSDQETKLTLVQGSVSLMDRTGKSELAKLKPGEMATYSTQKKIVKIDNVETDLYTSWVRGQFRFRKLSFDEIAKRLSRNFNVTFVFLNQELKNTTYNGSFYNYEPLDQILRIMKTNSPFSYSIQKDTVIIK